MEKGDKERFFYKDDGNRFWWVDTPDVYGPVEFSFDGKKVYNFWRDYPDKLTDEERRIFKEDCPFWAGFKGDSAT